MDNSAVNQPTHERMAVPIRMSDDWKEGQMGVDELSVAPSMILKLRKVVRKMRFKGLK